jgi:nicotinate-nucleotide adenylyltransferase
MNATLFGGSFDPPHLGHALVIQEFLASGKTDELWLLPTFNHSFDKQLTDSHHRLEMCNLLIKFLTPASATFDVDSSLLNTNLKLCPIEIDLQLSGQTYDTIEALKQNPPSPSLFQREGRGGLDSPDSSLLTPDYSFLMGSDQLPHFNKWGNYQELLKEMHFFVYPRANFPMEPLYENMEPFIHTDQTITNISSTLIRNRIKNQQDTSLLLPKEIKKYIEENKLYA